MWVFRKIYNWFKGLRKKKVPTLPRPISVRGDSRFIVKANNSRIAEAARIAHMICQDEEFLAEIRTIPGFYWSNDSGIEVAKKIQSRESVLIYEYTTKNPFSRVNAYRDPQTGSVYFNTRNLDRPMESLVDTGMHERMHIWYNHNGNLASGDNLESVPYEVGRRSRKYVHKYMRVAA